MFQLEIKPTSTFTTTKGMFVCFLLSMGIVLCSARARTTSGESAQREGSVAESVQRLGVHGNDDFADVKRLAETPATSMRLLVEALHPIPEMSISASQNIPSAEHGLWMIRALRYLTGGKDFYAITKHKFGGLQEEQYRKYWLYFGHQNGVSFFAMWPSRGIEYIAPEDAQREIISKWRNWFTTNGSSFHYEPLHNPKPSQWLW